MAGHLELRRGGRHRRWPRRLAAAAAALLLAGGLCLAAPRLAAQALGVPRRLLALAAPALERRLDALEEENRALRTALAAAIPLQQENDALRALLESPARPAAAVCRPARVTARAPGTMTLACAGAPVRPGCAVLDRRGRYAGAVTAVDGALLTVALPGAPACFVQESCGVLEAGPGGWRLSGLPAQSLPPAGSTVTTADGYWVGVLGTPEPDPNGLTAHAALTDTAFTSDSAYFVAAG